MKSSHNSGVFAALRAAASVHRLLTVGTLLCVAASVGSSLLAPLLLARIIDRLTAGLPLTAFAVLLYSTKLTLICQLLFYFSFILFFLYFHI